MASKSHYLIAWISVGFFFPHTAGKNGHVKIQHFVLSIVCADHGLIRYIFMLRRCHEETRLGANPKMDMLGFNERHVAFDFLGRSNQKQIVQ